MALPVPARAARPEPAPAELAASRALAFLDYFGVPHRVDAAGPAGYGVLRAGGPALYWLPAGESAIAEARLGDVPLWAHVTRDEASRGLRESLATGWTAESPVHDARGERIASVWRAADGSRFLPFDPDQAIRALLSEGYLAANGRPASARVKGLVRDAYYAARPLMPRRTQIAARRLYSRVQARAQFPRWPVETALHDLYAFLLGAVGDVVQGPFPSLAFWPHGRSWALVLTHDVETAIGRDSVHVLREVEQALGYRSSWNFVPRRYDDIPSVRAGLTEAGFEVGLHGLHHDGRDLAPGTFHERLPAMREAAECWGAIGFRSPATHRAWDLMPQLGVDYDSSYTDTAPFEPQSGGCCSWLPYFNRELVELPITLLQDHTLFEILEHEDERVWVEKAELLRERGGMALALTHPDYMLAPERVAAYQRFLERFAEDATAWRALPRDVSAWWRRRAASRLVYDRGQWQVAGPAAGEARVQIHEWKG